MDVYETMKKMQKVFGYMMVLALLLSLVTPAYAASTGTAPLKSAMKELCNSARTFLGLGAMLLTILAAVVYAVGQVVGAETRARASVWATAMLTGAVIGVVIYLLIPPVIVQLIGTGQGLATGADPCAFQ